MHDEVLTAHTPSNPMTTPCSATMACFSTSDSPPKRLRKTEVCVALHRFFSSFIPRSKRPLPPFETGLLWRGVQLPGGHDQRSLVCLVAPIRPSPLGKLSFVGLVAESRNPQGSSRPLASSWCALGLTGFEGSLKGDVNQLLSWTPLGGWVSYP
ncbi:hypothetical protein CCMA1212_008042 [Trichoderma ghanense]|uniref:Uncharacterized protein n=1 Tax=Trichoderma ghanense TaxID=65468 RepID=A0ABY2GXI2_9HYPO